jgi:hypothetical protein
VTLSFRTGEDGNGARSAAIRSPSLPPIAFPSQPPQPLPFYSAQKPPLTGFICLISPRRKLGEYLISNDYEPWPKTVTFSLLGLKRRDSETKTVTGPAIGLYKEYGFVNIANPQARQDEIIYQWVEEAIPYLKQILKSG